MPPISIAEQLEAEFSAKCELLSSLIEAVELTSLPDLRIQLEAMRELLAQGTEWWTKYDVRRNSEKLLSLEQEVDIATRRLKPRRRFRFSQALKSPESHFHGDATSQKTTLPVGLMGNGIVVDSSSVRNGKVELNNLDGQPVTVVGLKDVHMFLKGSPTALRLTNLTRCDVQAVVVNGSVFMSECNDCAVSVACHQLRIHQSKDCSVWSCSESSPIIEGCECMRFGELQVDGRRSCWDEIKDFSWLRGDPSPNWELLNESRVYRPSL